MKNKLSVTFVLLAFVLTAGLFLLSALINEALINVVLHHYHATPLDYGTALAVTGLLAIVGATLKSNTSK